MIEAGANALVAGSAVFGAKDYKEGKCPIYSDILRCCFLGGPGQCAQHRVVEFMQRLLASRTARGLLQFLRKPAPIRVFLVGSPH